MHATHRSNRAAAVCAGVAVLLAASTAGGAAHGVTTRHQQPMTVLRGTAGMRTIRHVVFIMQENRTFDHYFGTFPGADGIPRDANGVPTVCVPDPASGTCVQPYHNSAVTNFGGPHLAVNGKADIDGGAMDGFIAQAEAAGYKSPDVMGYHDGSDLPVYWGYAQQFTLQDHFFAPSISWSLPNHNYMVSGWSASCSNPADPQSCRTNLVQPDGISGQPETATAQAAWTDLTWLLHGAGVSWGYYITPGTQPDCDDSPQPVSCAPRPQCTGTPEIWNPLPDFQTVQQDGQLGNIQPVGNLYTQAQAGTLPAVSWVVPSQSISEHPTASIIDGQNYVSGVVNALMQSPDWPSTAIFLSWDVWGGFYDHVPPPAPGGHRLGIRVPGIVISPWAKRGYIDSQVLSTDSYLKFVEDVFLGGARLDPATDGRPDSRPVVRETLPGMGDLAADFDFTQHPTPVVTALTPPQAAPAGGTSVTITGSGFTAASAVHFGVASATYVVSRDSRILATVPPGSPATVDVTVTTPSGTSAVNTSDRFTWSAQPAVSAVTPTTTDAQGGALATITGSNFTGATAVQFGSTASPVFAVNSDTSITATVPAGPAGTAVPVTVTGPGGTSPVAPGVTLGYASGFAIWYMSSTGVHIPSQSSCFNITGVGFTGATGVLFGTTAASEWAVASDGVISVVPPPRPPGTVDVRVVTPSGMSPVTPADAYTYR